MFKITLIKKYSMKDSIHHNIFYTWWVALDHTVNSQTMTILCASFLKVLHAIEFLFDSESVAQNL
jgi:hypothetical protein